MTHDFSDTISNSAIVGTLREVLENGFRAKSKSMMSFNKREAIKVAIVAIQNRTEAEKKIEAVRTECEKLWIEASASCNNECLEKLPIKILEILEGEK